MVSDFVFTEQYCTGDKEASDPIALGEYQLDSHHCQRVVVFDEDGKAYVTNEGNVEKPTKTGYGIAYRAITPRKNEAQNLLVTCAVSASHIAFGSIRMEPVFMNLGQSAAIAASLAIDSNVPVQEVTYSALRPALLNAGQILVKGEIPTNVQGINLPTAKKTPKARIELGIKTSQDRAATQAFDFVGRCINRTDQTEVTVPRIVVPLRKEN